MVYPLDYNANLTSEELSYANNGQLEFNVTTPQYTSGYLYGKLPRLSRSSCNTETKVGMGVVLIHVWAWLMHTLLHIYIILYYNYYMYVCMYLCLDNCCGRRQWMGQEH